MQIPKFQQLYDRVRAEIQSRRPDLTDWNEGSALDAIAGGSAMLADESMRYMLELFSELFFDTATGEALDRLALDRTGLTRKPATAAYGTVRVTKGNPTATYTLPAGTVFRAILADGSSFTALSVQDVPIRSDQLFADVLVVASSLGRTSNLAPGVLNEFMSAPVADPDATAISSQALAGGADAETDSAFRDRIRRFYSTLRRGTIAALELGSLSVPGVAYVHVDESLVESAGTVLIYVGDPDARSNTTLASLVEAELVNWRAAGVQVLVFGSARLEVPLALLIKIKRGADQVTIAAAVRAAIVGYGDSIAPSRPAHLSRIAKAVHEASGLVLSTQVTSHTVDIEPTLPYEATRFLSSSIALSFVEVDT